MVFHVDDHILVEAARAGDLDAYDTLVRRHQAAVYRVALRMLGSSADADDVTQDTFLRAFHRLDRFRGRGSFRSWLLQIAHNTALNELARRVPEPTGAAHEIVPDAPPARAPGGPAVALEESERRERLELKLTELSDEHRAVLVLRDLEGLSYEEIADITESPIGSVKGRLHRARNEMIEIMRRNTYDWELPR